MDDRTKYAEYTVLDIPEYWIIDAIESKATVCTLSEGFYGNQVFSEDQSMVFDRSGPIS
jgi:Uma2 family endonuclease